jgi:hypothetical protein
MNADQKREFLGRVTDQIQGMLLPLAARQTLDLLDFQEARGIKGGVLEIGVFCGKYFSLLLHSANTTGCTPVGIDTFEFAPENQVLDLLGRNGADSSRVRLLSGRSRDFSASEVRKHLGEPARFISVDGSHEKPDVLYDLSLSDVVLGNEGIVAADDFLNCVCLGVNEAIIEYLAKSSKDLVPFAYIPNKLLLCRPKMRETYADHLLSALLADPFDEIGRRVCETARADPSKIYSTLAGSPVLICS